MFFGISRRRRRKGCPPSVSSSTARWSGLRSFASSQAQDTSRFSRLKEKEGGEEGRGEGGDWVSEKKKQRDYCSRTDRSPSSPPSLPLLPPLPPSLLPSLPPLPPALRPFLSSRTRADALPSARWPETEPLGSVLTAAACATRSN